MSILRILLIAAVIIFVIVGRLRGEPLQARRLLLLPLIIAVIGAVDLVRSAAQLRTADLTLLAVSAVVALGLGALRGATIKVFARDGHPWQRYTVLTVIVWVLLVGVRIGVGVAAHQLSAPLAAGTTSLLLMLGLSLLAEGAVVAPRARSLGLPFAPAPQRRTMR